MTWMAPIVLAVVSSLLATRAVVAQIAFDSDVKTYECSYVYLGSADGTASAHFNSFSAPLVRFDPVNHEITISPLSDDPRVHTVDPVTWGPLQDVDGDGYVDLPFCWTTYSLLDLGTYIYRLTGTSQTAGAVTPFEPTDVYLRVDDSGISLQGVQVTTPTDVGVAVTLQARAHHLSDAGTVAAQTWRILASPNPAATVTGVSAEPPMPVTGTTTTVSAKIPFTDERDIGNWTVELGVDDSKGLRTTRTIPFTIPNVAPTLTISGRSSTYAFSPIQLTVVNLRDPDGGDPTVTWSVREAPGGASVVPPADVSNTSHVSLPTTERDIGMWRFRATARDNEGADSFQEIVFSVRSPCLQLSDAGLPLPMDRKGSVQVARVRHDLSAAQLTRLKYGEAMPRDKVLLGYTRGSPQEPAVSYVGRGSSVPSTNLVCYWTGDWGVAISLPVEVFIAREYVVGSCAYQALLDHEMEHVSAFQAVLDKSLGEMLARLSTSSIPRTRTTSYLVLDEHAGKTRVDEIVSAVIRPAYRRYLELLAEADGPIDTPENLARTRARCPSGAW